MQYSEFSYENLQAQSLRRAGQFESVPVNTSFFAVCNDQVSGSGTGWKIHISVAGADVGRAWNLMADYLIDQQIGQMKVATPDCAARFDKAEARQSGKMITVYDFGLGHDWQGMTQAIEHILESNGIRPGHQVKGDRTLPGSRYMSYRNDKALDGRYVDSREIARYPAHQQYNISGRPDPFGNIRVSSGAQGLWADAAMRSGPEKTVPRHPAPAPPPVSQPVSQPPAGIPEAKYWKAQRDQFDNPLMSLPIEGAPQSQVEQVRALLRRHGFSPDERDSKSMGGRVLYVAKDDAIRLKQELGPPQASHPRAPQASHPRAPQASHPRAPQAPRPSLSR